MNLKLSIVIQLSSEIQFQTTRSGGKGGQNVNKVETAVIGTWHIESSHLINEEQKAILKEKLSNRINSEGYLFVKSQTHRTQLSNKEEVIKKMHDLVAHALIRKKLRIPTKVSKASKERRIESKKRKADIKSLRGRIRKDDY